MRSYPKEQLSKQDYENLLAMPEHADRARADLLALAAIDDSMISVDQGTPDAPMPVQIDNPTPAWKRAGFEDKAELAGQIAPAEDEKADLNDGIGTAYPDALEK